MRNDRVPIPVLHVAHDAKCFPPCVYSYFITKMPMFGLYEYKVEASGCGFKRKRHLAETDS